MKRAIKVTLCAAAGIAVLGTAWAQAPGRGPGQGPVMTQCKDDMAKLFAGKKHDGEVRAYLEGKKAQASAACKTALDSSGGGKGKKQ